jgi:hypothetical protein
MTSDNQNNTRLMALTGTLEKLRLRAEELLLEKDNLLYHICPSLKTAYTVFIGTHEYTLFKLDLIYQSIRRKIELVQAKINREEAYNIRDIDNQIDSEFSSYNEKLNSWSDILAKEVLAISSGEALSKDEINEIKSLYHFIVKKIHPDINKNLTDKDIALFNIAVNAYKENQVAPLLTVKALLSELPDRISSSNLMIMEINRFERLIPTLLADIEKIKTTFPYTKNELLEDENKVNEEISSLKQKIEKKNEEIQLAEKKLALLIGEENGRQIH